MDSRNILRRKGDYNVCVSEKYTNLAKAYIE